MDTFMIDTCVIWFSYFQYFYISFSLWQIMVIEIYFSSHTSANITWKSNTFHDISNCIGIHKPLNDSLESCNRKNDFLQRAFSVCFHTYAICSYIWEYYNIMLVCTKNILLALNHNTMILRFIMLLTKHIHFQIDKHDSVSLDLLKQTKHQIHISMSLFIFI